MGFGSSTTRGNNSLKEAMDEGLQKPYRFTSEDDCISDFKMFLGAFETTDNAFLREMMIAHAASSVAGIKTPKIRNRFMDILERCSRLSPDECIKLTAEERDLL